MYSLDSCAWMGLLRWGAEMRGAMALSVKPSWQKYHAQVCIIFKPCRMLPYQKPHLPIPYGNNILSNQRYTAKSYIARHAAILSNPIRSSSSNVPSAVESKSSTPTTRPALFLNGTTISDSVSSSHATGTQ